MSDLALFRPDGASTFVPTSAAVGPWDPRIVHGAAVAALLAGRLAPDHGTLARLTVELLAPVPLAPLTFERSSSRGGSRVERQDGVLACDGREVATATALTVRRSELELPEKAVAHVSPFDPAAAPPLSEPNRSAADVVGWECFDSRSLIIGFTGVEGDRRVHEWIRLAVPVVEGTEIRGVELAAVAADYAQTGLSRLLPIADWSYRNAELTVHLARDPVGSWIGVRCESVVQPVGAGFNASDLFDADGRFGRSAAAVVVERRS